MRKLTNRRGFTLIELLIVVVVLGLLASIAVLRYRSARTRSFLAVMQTDLNNLATSQEQWQNETGSYYGGTLSPSPLAYVPSAGVTMTMVSASANGWAARATSPALPGVECALFRGDAPPVAPATAENLITCTATGS